MTEKVYNNIEYLVNYEHLNSKYRFTYHEFANLIEWEERVPISWWRQLFSFNGQTHEWKRVYFGHITPVEKCVETFWRGVEARDKANKTLS